MARTTSELVAALLDTLPSGESLTPFIDTANALVTELCVPQGYGAALLELIERWLAAHFYSIKHPRPNTSQTIAAVSETYGRPLSFGLKLTEYGQQALTLDVLGGLQTAGTRRKAGVMWLGQEEFSTP